MAGELHQDGGAGTANEFETGRLPQGTACRCTLAALALPQPLSALLAAQVNLDLATAAIFMLQADARDRHSAGRPAAPVAPISTRSFACARQAGWSRCCVALLGVLRVFLCHSGVLFVWLARVRAQLIKTGTFVSSYLP